MLQLRKEQKRANCKHVLQEKKLAITLKKDGRKEDLEKRKVETERHREVKHQKDISPSHLRAKTMRFS